MDKHNDLNEEPPLPNHLNNALALVMHKILKTRKPKRKKTVVLAKAKKLSLKYAITTQKDIGSGDEISHNNLVKNSDWILKGRMKPNPLQRNYEKRLLKLTISGVVNMFNAVNQYKNSGAKSDPVIKNLPNKLINKSKFLGILSNGSVSSNNENAEHDEAWEENCESSDTWAVLKNDFGNDTKLRNWDKALSADK